MPKRKRLEDKQDAELIPEPDFEMALEKVLSTSKEESDRQLAEFQASNKARREEPYLKAKPKSLAHDESSKLFP